MANTLIDAAKLHEYYDINKDIKDGRLVPHIGAASRRVRAWVGQDAYADALAADPQDDFRAEDLKNAEASLAMHFALLGLNTRLTVDGVIKTSKAVQGNAVQSYLVPAEVRQLAQLYLEQAEEIARPYLLNDGTPEAEFATVEDE